MHEDMYQHTRLKKEKIRWNELFVYYTICSPPQKEWKNFYVATQLYMDRAFIFTRLTNNILSINGVGG